MMYELRGKITNTAQASLGCYPGIYRFHLATADIYPYRLRNGLVLCETIITVPPDGTYVVIKGHREGTKFAVREMVLDTSSLDLSKELIKGAVKNVKEKNPEIKISSQLPGKMAKVMGEDAIAYLKEHKDWEDLKRSFPKTKEEILSSVYNELKYIVNGLEIVSFLNKFNIPSWKISRLIQKLGIDAAEILKEHPYDNGMKGGLGFLECDKIAFYLKKEEYSSERLTAACIGGIKNIFNTTGSTYCAWDLMYRASNRLLRRGSYSQSVLPLNALYKVLAADKRFCLFENKGENMITLSYMRRYEESIAFNVERIAGQWQERPMDWRCLKTIERLTKRTYEEEQRKAIEMVSGPGLYILTGGPGTGKTTTLEGIIKRFQLMGKTGIICCAPTGRAAQRMKETTEMDAVTIHKLLGITPTEMTSQFNRVNPLKADLIITDEFSMVDTEICSLLLDAVDNGTAMLIVGDEEQLRSVGPGNVLHDLLKSGKAKTIRLTKILRQEKEGSSIIENAKRIREGNFNLTEDKDFRIITCTTELEAREKILELFLDTYDEDDPFKVQFMDPLKKGTVGTMSLNASVKEKFCPCPGRSSGKFRPGDRVIFTKNNSFLEYFNGDLGIVESCSEKRAVIIVRDKRVEITGDELQDVELSYFITVHKSQGSEFEECVLLLPEEPKIMLTRNLLNTAITRAKKKITIVQVNNAIKDSLQRGAPAVNTGLGLLLAL